MNPRKSPLTSLRIIFFKDNILRNGFEQIITTHRVAVVGNRSGQILFPKKSSVFKRVQDARHQESDGCATMPPIPLSVVVETLATPSLMKMDCKGGEYEMVLKTESVAFDRISGVRLEFYHGLEGRLFSGFKEIGYVQRRYMDEGEGGAYL